MTNSRAGVSLAAVALFCSSAGYFIGREHVKYEIRTAMAAAFSAASPTPTISASEIPTREAPRSPPAVWDVAESKSPVDDSPQIVATDVSTEGLEGKRAALIVRCKEHRTETFIASADFWGTYAGAEGVPVLYRINSSAPVERKWNPGINSGLSSSVFFPDGERETVAFLMSLPAAGKIFFRVTGYQGAAHDMTFTLDGLADVRARVSGACGWPHAGNVAK